MRAGVLSYSSLYPYHVGWRLGYSRCSTKSYVWVTVQTSISNINHPQWSHIFTTFKGKTTFSTILCIYAPKLVTVLECCKFLISNRSIHTHFRIVLRYCFSRIISWFGASVHSYTVVWEDAQNLGTFNCLNTHLTITITIELTQFNSGID